MENNENLTSEENNDNLTDNNDNTAAEEAAATAVLSADDNLLAEENLHNALTQTDAAPVKPTKLQQFLQLLKFTVFMVSAGVIQFVTTGALSTWTNLIPYWIGYLIGLVLSVVWSFTFNRKFTFKAANNVPLAMSLVVFYYCIFAPISTFGADAIVDSWKTAAGSGWVDDYEMVITAGMMILNFVTEFFWDKFIVFNQKLTDKILNLFKKK